MAPSYCNTDDMRTAGNRWVELQNDEATRAAVYAESASRWVESVTGTWFYKRHLRITTEAPSDGTLRLWMPAPLNGALESLVEDGNAFDLAQVLVYDRWLQKAMPGVPSVWWGNGVVPSLYWSNTPQGIKIEGHFGPDTWSSEITTLTAHVAAALMGWGTRSYATGDGVEKQALNTELLPDWLKLIISRYKTNDFHGQVMKIQDI